MALTQTQVSQLYVSIIGRASEGNGNTFWQGASDMDTAATSMLESDAAKTYFGTSLDTNQAFIEHIYQNTLGKTVADDPDGIAFWVAELDSGTSKGAIVTSLIDAAMSPDVTDKDAQNLFINQVAVSDYCADTIPTSDPSDLSAFTGYITGVTSDAASVDTVKATIDAAVHVSGETFTLTNGSDIATANIFNADMVYTPDGSDRILSLQDEDKLTGTADRSDNTLNAEIGNMNTDEGTTATVTPELSNIQVVNLEWTGNTTTVDLRYADDVDTVHINKITADATAVNVNNITTPAANLKVADAADAATAVTFNYQRGVLAGDETASIELNNVLARSVTQEALGTGAGVEGFEAVNLNVINGVDINILSINEMETLTITGDSYLDIVTLTPATGAGAGTAIEYMALGAPGIANPSAVGLLNLDASAFEGDLTIDITNALGGFNDPANSGAVVHTEIIGGVGDDTFWTSADVAANSETNRDILDGGEGDNTLVTTAGVAGDAAVSNIQSLELRQQAGVQTVDFDAFDENLTSVLMRGEAAGASTFTLNDLEADLAANGLVLRHGITGATAPTVNVNLKDATGTDDTVAVTVENDLNTSTTFDYIINADMDTPSGNLDSDQGVENIIINDNDTESNIVNLTEADEHTGTITLAGGSDGNEFTINDTLIAATVEASAQISDLRLTVGTEDQTINLGEGDDILTFVNPDDFSGADIITDAGGEDTIRAAFSEDVTGAPSLDGIEKLHIVANDNVTIDMSNAATVSELAIMSDAAVDGTVDISPITNEPFNITGVNITDIITLQNTDLSALNFFGDNDVDDDLTDAETQTQNFNGVTLENNSIANLDVNINSSLDNDEAGVLTYNIGQLTVHGATSMNVEVADEATGAVTTIDNIWAKDMASLTLTAANDLNLGTVSGGTLNNTLTVFDASAVGGDLTAHVISLGDAAVVTLADGDNVFSGLSSAGKLVEITAGNGDNDITGTAQSDTIVTGLGDDIIAGDRGDNIIQSGAGDDIITAKDGNDTVDAGSGINSVTINDTTGLDGSQATNTVSLNNSVTHLQIDVTGDGAFEVDQYLTAGVGADLTVSYTGATMNAAAAVLNGRLATVAEAGSPALFTGTANSDLVIVTNAYAAPNYAFNGDASADTLIGEAANVTYLFDGGAGNDSFTGNNRADIITGGEGADMIVLTKDGSAAAGVADIINVADGDSVVSGWDQVVGTAVGDTLFDLATATVAADAANVDGDNAGTVESHTIENGMVTFDINDSDVFSDVLVGDTTTDTDADNQISLDDAFSYLAANLNGTGETVVFEYDRDGDGTADDTFIFQDGAEDTVIQLVDTTGVAGITTDGTQLTLAGVVVNNAPVAGDDDFGTTDNATPVIINVLANDNDGDGGAPGAGLSIVGVNQVDGVDDGIVTISADAQSLIFAPTADYVGDALFGYTVSDGIDTTNALVTGTVTAAGGANVIDLAEGTSDPVAATADAEVFALDVDAALAMTANTQIAINDFDTVADSLQLDIATAGGVDTLDDLDGVDGIAVQTAFGDTLVTFGADANGDVVSITLTGVSDAGLVVVDAI